MILYSSWRTILVVSAVLPALFLLVRTWRLDRLEKESPSLLVSLVVLGIVSTVLAIAWERVGTFLLDRSMSERDPAYHYVFCFLVVGLGEELCKFVLLYRRTWREREFNCTYDAVVYAVFLSLGFALWENVRYVFAYGLSTALVRAMTAVPGHASFGVFMGVWYGRAKALSLRRDHTFSRACLLLCVLIPAALHGLYDFIATDTSAAEWVFPVFILTLFALSYAQIRRSSRQDAPLR